MSLISDIGGFLSAVAAQWMLLVGGLAITLISLLVERRREKEISWPWYRRLMLACLAVAVFLAWQEKHHALTVADTARQTANTQLADANKEIEKLRHQQPLKVEVQQESATQAAELARRQMKIDQLEQDLVRERAARSALEDRLDDRKRRGQTTDALVGFVREGMALRDRCIRERCSDDVEKAVNEWYRRALQFVSENLGQAYAERFKDGQSYSDVLLNFPMAKMPLYNGIRGRIARLHEFIKEFQS